MSGYTLNYALHCCPDISCPVLALVMCCAPCHVHPCRYFGSVRQPLIVTIALLCCGRSVRMYDGLVASMSAYMSVCMSAEWSTGQPVGMYDCLPALPHCCTHFVSFGAWQLKCLQTSLHDPHASLAVCNYACMTVRHAACRPVGMSAIIAG